MTFFFYNFFTVITHLILFYYYFIIARICCLSSLHENSQSIYHGCNQGSEQFGFWLCQSRDCENKGNKLGSELFAMLPRARFVFGMMTCVTRSSDLLRYLQGWLAEGEGSKTGSLPFCKVKMRSVTHKSSLRCMQHTKRLRGKKGFLINEDCNTFVWRKCKCNLVYKYSVHCLLFQPWFWIPSSALSAKVTCLTWMRSKGPEKHRIIFNQVWKYQFTYQHFYLQLFHWSTRFFCFYIIGSIITVCKM